MGKINVGLICLCYALFIYPYFTILLRPLNGRLPKAQKNDVKAHKPPPGPVVEQAQGFPFSKLRKLKVMVEYVSHPAHV